MYICSLTDLIDYLRHDINHDLLDKIYIAKNYSGKQLFDDLIRFQLHQLRELNEQYEDLKEKHGFL